MNEKNHTVKAVLTGVLASFFFSFTFLLNRSIGTSGGYWMWSACLRYFVMFLIYLVVMQFAGGVRPVFKAIAADKGPWFLWSTVGFGVFYLPVTYASLWGESWFTSASWELTIVCGVLLTPLFGKPIPVKNLLASCVILVGVGLLQTSQIAHSEMSAGQLGMALVAIVIAAFAYPLGNRKMMMTCPPELNTMQRIFGMITCSLPFWCVTAVLAYVNSGLPSGGQIVKCSIVALFSGTVATGLFFYATNLVKKNMKALAAVEATQCGEVVFTLIGGVLILKDSMPAAAGMAGLVLIVAGMIVNSLMSE